MKLPDRDQFRTSRRRFLRDSAAMLAGTMLAGNRLAVALGKTATGNRLFQEEEALDVTDFGATGDGITNDRQAFQQAIDAAIDERMPLRIPRPSAAYRIELDNNHDRLEVNGDLTVLGEGRENTLLFFSISSADGRDFSGFFVHNNSDVKFSDLRMEEDVHPTEYEFSGFHFESGSKDHSALINRVDIAGFTHCIYVPSSGSGDKKGELFLTLRKCDLSPDRQYCVSFWSVEDGHKRLHMYDCYLHDNQESHLVYCHPHNSVHIENTRFDGATSWAFQFQGSAIAGDPEYQRFIGCWFGPRNSRGIITQSRDEAYTRVEIRNCIFEGRPAVQIRSDVLVDGCYFTTLPDATTGTTFISAYNNAPWRAEILNCVFSPRANSLPLIDIRLEGIEVLVDNCQFYNQHSGTIIAMGGDDANQYRIANSLFFTRAGNEAQSVALDIEDGNVIVERCRFVGRAIGDRGMVVFRSSEDSPGPEARFQIDNSLFQSISGGSVYHATVTAGNSWSNKIFGRNMHMGNLISPKPILTVQPEGQPVYGHIKPVPGTDPGPLTAGSTLVVNSNFDTYRVMTTADVSSIHWWYEDGLSDQLFSGVVALVAQHGFSLVAGGNIDPGASGRLDIAEHAQIKLLYESDPGIWTIVGE